MNYYKTNIEIKEFSYRNVKWCDEFLNALHEIDKDGVLLIYHDGDIYQGPSNKYKAFIFDW